MRVGSLSGRVDSDTLEANVFVPLAPAVLLIVGIMRSPVFVPGFFAVHHIQRNIFLRNDRFSLLL